MIDIFPKVFSDVYTAVTTVNANANVLDVTPERLAEYPAVILRETNNVPIERTNTVESSENYTRITVELDVRSNKVNGAEAEARALFEAAEGALKNLFFRRVWGRKLPAQDRTIYRMYGSYEVICRAPFESGDNTIYQLYRR